MLLYFQQLNYHARHCWASQPPPAWLSCCASSHLLPTCSGNYVALHYLSTLVVFFVIGTLQFDYHFYFFNQWRVFFRFHVLRSSKALEILFSTSAAKFSCINYSFVILTFSPWEFFVWWVLVVHEALEGGRDVPPTLWCFFVPRCSHIYLRDYYNLSVEEGWVRDV